MSDAHGLTSEQKLPHGWRHVALGELCRLVNGDAYKETDWSRSGLPIIRIQNLNDWAKPFNYWSGSLDGRVVVNEGDVLLAWSGTPGTSFGAHMWRGPQGVLNQPIFRVDIDTARVYAPWAVIAINEQLDQMIGKAHGAVGLRHVTKGEVERLQVLLPPIEEQERIAAILKEQMEAVERARAATQAQLDAAKALPAAYLREVFPQPGQPLPDGWRWSMLGDLCDRPGQYGTSKKSNGDRKGAPVLGMYHIYDGRIRWENMSHIELTSDELSRYLLSCGDLLFNRTNSAELVGKTAVYDLDAEAVFASYLIRFRLAKDTADPHFVCAYINSRNGRSFIERNMARAIGQVNISASTMHKMPIPIPDIAEQRRIAGVFREQMAAVKRLQAGLEAQLAEINVLPAALLRRAFNGGV